MKSSVVADMVAQGGPNDGRSVAHTRSGAGEGDDQGDLLVEVDAFAQELELFEGSDVRPPKRGPGRPAGSPNRSTLKLQQLLMQRGYRDPAEFLAAIVTGNARDLAAAMRPDGLVKAVTFDQAHEVRKLQVRAAEALMPFFHQKMPIAVQHSGDGQRPVIIINDADGLNRVVQAVKDQGAMSAHDVVQYQGVSEDKALASDEKAVSSDG